MAQTVSSAGNQALRTVDEVPEPYNSVFSKYSYFNAIQSTVFNDIFYTDDSIAVAAPTGSGKTALFELGVVRLLMSLDNSEYKQDYKIIYVAPMKAICEERLVDWHLKFSPFGVNSISVTGDTDNVDYQCLKLTNIIITTPEKWDSITRNWRDNENLIRSVRLFMIDEVHLLNDETRGSALEAAITRMKTINTYGRGPLRFIAVSATVANIEDVAQWFDKPQTPAKHYKFPDDMRPVHLQKKVLGYPYNAKLSSPFKFDIMLSYKLHHILLQYTAGKPTLVFCSTRKSVEMTSKQLMQNLTITLTPQQRTALSEACREIKNTKITETLMHGVGCHHAGMLPEHRRLIETLFKETNLPVLVTTSTLAMGVNLPAHLVVIKSTKYYANGEFKDYSETMISQMIGRAGRPQFDTSGTAVIMTTTDDKHKYENMVSGEVSIESHLRRHLVEFVNAEVVLRTITDLSVAMQWLSSTFLYIRARKNPRHYGLPIGLNPSQLDKKLLEMCQIEINKLAKAGMLTIDTDITILPTEIGRLMARNCISFETMKLFTQVNGSETLQQVLGLISKCQEFQEIRLRSNDKSTLNLLNKCRNRRTIRFTLNGRIKTLEMKINCVIQAVLGCLEIVESWLLVEAQKVMRIGERLLLCLSEYLETRSSCYQALLNSIILSKCLHARIWENSQYVSRQLEGIGVTLSNALVDSGKKSFKDLLEANPRELERITKRKPPFGNSLQDQVRLIPSYKLIVQTKDVDKSVTISIDISLENASEFNGQMSGNPYGIMHLLVGDSENNILFHRKYNHLCMVENLSITQTIEVPFGEEREVFINFISQEWVGIDCKEKLVLFPDPNKPKPTELAPPKSSTKLVRKKSPQQQYMNKYFKQMKTLPRKKSSDKLMQDKTSEKMVDESNFLDVSIVESSQQPISNTDDDHSLGNILQDCLKRVAEAHVSKPESVLKTTPSAAKTDIVASSSDILKSHLAMVESTFKPKPVKSYKKEVLSKRNKFMCNTRAMELEASLYTDAPDLSQFAKCDKKKISHDEDMNKPSTSAEKMDKPAEASKSITWKSPVFEQMQIKHSPGLSKPKEVRRPTLKNRIPMYPLSDKDWSYNNPKKYGDVLSKSHIESLETEKTGKDASSEDFISLTALNVFGLDDKSEKVDLNATTSSTSSVKTKITDSTISYFSEVGERSVVEKMRKAIPAINDELLKEESEKPDETKETEDGKELGDTKEEGLVEKPEGSKGLKRRYSWEDDFLAIDPMVEFADVLTQSNDDGFKKFKELEESIVKRADYKPEPIYKETVQKQLTKQTLFHDNKPTFHLTDDRLDPEKCLGFKGLEENFTSIEQDYENLPDYDAMAKAKYNYEKAKYDYEKSKCVLLSSDVSSRNYMEETPRMDGGYFGPPQYRDRHFEMPRHQFADAREGLMDYECNQMMGRRFNDPPRVLYNNPAPFRQDYPITQSQMLQYHCSNYVSQPNDLPNCSYREVRQPLMQPMPYTDFPRNKTMLYNNYPPVYPHPSDKIDAYPFGQPINSYGRLATEHPYGHYSRGQGVLTPINQMEPHIHQPNFQNQILDNSYNASLRSNLPPASINEPSCSNTGDKKYIMDKFLLSQPSLNRNHTLTSKDMYDQSFEF